jgi:hypothetical protein
VYFVVGAMSLDSPAKGQWELSLEGESGPPGQLQVDDVASVTGRRVQVRSAGGQEVYLEGIAPAVADDDGEVDCGGDDVGVGGGDDGNGRDDGNKGVDNDGDNNDGNNGNGNSKACVKKGEMALQRPEDAPDPDAFGKVCLQKKKGVQEFECEAGKLPAGQSGLFRVFVESAAGSGDFVEVGGMTPKGAAKGSWRLSLQAKGAAPSSLGVLSLSTLQGREVQVRIATGFVFLHGKCPMLGSSPGILTKCKKSSLTNSASALSPKAVGSLRVKLNAAKGCSSLDVRVKGLSHGHEYSVWIETAPGSGLFANAGLVEFKSVKSKQGAYRRDSKKGDPLPLGVTSISQLSGRRIEVREGVSSVQLGGVIP